MLSKYIWDYEAVRSEEENSDSDTPPEVQEISLQELLETLPETQASSTGEESNPSRVPTVEELKINVKGLRCGVLTLEKSACPTQVSWWRVFFPPRCAQCGRKMHAGESVIEFKWNDWIEGWREVLVCADRQECNLRWEKKNRREMRKIWGNIWGNIWV